MVWYRVRGTEYEIPTISGAPVAQPAPTKFGTKVVIVTYSPNRSCVPNVKLLASTVAERSRGPKFFRCCLAQTPTSFCTKSCFFVSYCPSPSCIANLNLLASMTAKINTGVPIFNFFLDAPLARTPANCGPKSCFLVSYTPSPTCIPNLKLLASMIAEINRGSQIFWILP